MLVRFATLASLRRAYGAVFLAGIGSSALLAQEPTAPPISTPSHQQIADGELVDTRSAFALRAPRGWRVMPEGEASAIDLDACAGLYHDEFAWVILLRVFPWPNGSLERLADTEIERAEDEQLDGLRGPVPCVSAQVAGAEEALRLRWRTREMEETLFRHELLLARRGMWYYACKLLAAEPQEPSDVAALAALDDVLRLLPQYEPRPQLPEHAANGEDLDTIVEGGVIRNLGSGFVLRTPSGWRALDRGTTRMEFDAHACFFAEDGLTTCEVGATPRADAEPLDIAQLEIPGDALGSRRELEVGGLRAQLWFRGAELPSQCAPEEPTARAWLLVEGPAHKLCFFADTRAHADGQRLGETLLEIARGVSVMDEAERAQRLDELAARRDRDPDLDFEELITPHCSLRLGVFEDFEHGFRLRRPTGRWPWRMAYEEHEHDDEEEVELEGSPLRVIWMRCLGLGLGVELTLVRSPSDVHFFQGLLVNEYAEFGEMTPVEVAREVELGGRSFLVERCDFLPAREFDLEQLYPRGRYLFATTVLRDDLLLCIRIHGARIAKPELEEALRSIVAGLEVDEEPRPSVQETERGWIDHRIGFRFEAVAERWKPKREEEELGEDWVAYRRVARGLSNCILFATHFPDAPPVRRSALGAGELSSFLDRFDVADVQLVPLRAGTRDELVGGRPGRRSTYDLRTTNAFGSSESAGKLVAWQVWRGCTCFTLVLQEATTSGNKSRYADAVLPGFELLLPGR
jgi:hypothetical protein